VDEGKWLFMKKSKLCFLQPIMLFFFIYSLDSFAIKRSIPFMGTQFTVTADVKIGEDKLFKEIYQEILRIEKMNAFKSSNSEISRLNANGRDKPLRVSKELVGLIKIIKQLFSKTYGYFDVSFQSSCKCSPTDIVINEEKSTV
jgi:thiamine biosynthesis lipoprotein ApbE